MLAADNMVQRNYTDSLCRMRHLAATSRSYPTAAQKLLSPMVVIYNCEVCNDVILDTQNVGVWVMHSSFFNNYYGVTYCVHHICPINRNSTS